jgi:signal transduction histidine kinase
MQQNKQTAELGTGDRKRVETVVETLATLRSEDGTLAEVAHDARNMVTALGLYCDLLEEQGVLTASFAHYGNELRLIATASRRLVEKLVALDTRETPSTAATLRAMPELDEIPAEASDEPFAPSHRWDLMPAKFIDSLAEELLSSRNLLTALAGPAIPLTMDIEGGVLPVRLTTEDLTRVLVNLVKNAVEAMPKGGRIQLGLRELATEPGATPWLAMTIEDNGSGISLEALSKVFESGYTTRSNSAEVNNGWQITHRGLGLNITRSIVEAAGGKIHATKRTPTGARFEIKLPVRTR